MDHFRFYEKERRVMLITADELSSKPVTVRYNEEKLLDCVAVRRAEMIDNQLEDTMKCEAPVTN